MCSVHTLHTLQTLHTLHTKHTMHTLHNLHTLHTLQTLHTLHTLTMKMAISAILCARIVGKKLNILKFSVESIDHDHDNDHVHDTQWHTVTHLGTEGQTLIDNDL